MRHKFSGLFLVALATAFTQAPAEAARVTPMITEIDEIGRGAITRIEVTNTDDWELPLELRVYRGEVSEDGKLNLIPADEDFLVFPPQAVIQGLRQQTFRVQYLGAEPLSASQAYYISVKEVPVQLQPGTSRVQVIMDFNVLVNVVPEGSQAAPAVDYVRSVEREGVTGLEVRVLNQGTKFFAAGRLPWSIRGKTADGEDLRVNLTADDVGKSTGYGLVLPGQARIFFIPTDRTLQSDTVEITLGA